MGRTDFSSQWIDSRHHIEGTNEEAVTHRMPQDLHRLRRQLRYHRRNRKIALARVQFARTSLTLFKARYFSCWVRREGMAIASRTHYGCHSFA